MRGVQWDVEAHKSCTPQSGGEREWLIQAMTCISTFFVPRRLISKQFDREV